MTMDERDGTAGGELPAMCTLVALTVEAIGQAFLSEVIRLPGAQTAALVCAHESADTLEVIAAHGLPDSVVTGMANLRLDDPLPIAMAAADRTPVILPSRQAAAELGAAALTEFERCGIGSLIAVPLLDGAASPGAIAVGFRDERAVDAATVDLLMTLGRLAVPTIAHARAAQFQAEREARDRAERLRAFAAQIASAVTVADVAEAAVGEGVRTLHAVAGTLALARGSEDLEVAADAGGLLTGEPQFLASASALVADVLAAAEPRFLDDVTAEGWRFPQAARCLAMRGLSAAVVLPLVVQDAALGVVVFAFDRPQKADVARRGFLEAIAGQAAQALERVRLHTTVVAERALHVRARRRAEFAGGLLASLDATDGTAHRIDRFLDAFVPDIADFASVELLGESGELAVAAVRHRDPALQPAFEALRRQHAVGREIVGSVADVAATGRPHLFELTPGSADEYSVRPPAREAFGRLRPRSVMTLPLGPPGRRIGALLVGTSDSSERAFDTDDLAYFDALTQQVGLSFDNARLYERHRQVSLRLQQSLLADSVPELPGLAVAAYYEPAAADLEVGGDWCEAIELPDGRVGLFVGDVVGRGLTAAAAMGQLRAAVSALALTCETPARLIDRLALFAETIPAADCATVVAAMLDRHTGKLTYACAGHPPPLLVSANGDTHFLEDGRSVPLVVTTRLPRTDAHVTLERGTRVVLFSDGLVERRGESIDVGLTRLATAARTRRRLPGPEFVEALVADLTVGQHRLDDIAVLCVDLASDAAVRFLRRFSASAQELAGLRVAMRDWFAVNGITDGDANDILLAVGEAVANAVEHAYVPGTSGDVEVELVREGAQMTLRVRDRGTWSLVPAPGDRGRGLPLMRAVSDVTVRRSLSGTTVTMRRNLTTSR